MKIKINDVEYEAAHVTLVCKTTEALNKARIEIEGAGAANFTRAETRYTSPESPNFDTRVFCEFVDMQIARAYPV